MEVNIIYNEDCLVGLKKLPDNCIDCCVTSPPYFNQRDYQVDGQIGLENTVDEYINSIVDIFSEVRRVLKPTGQLWLNIGDTYSNYKDSKSTKQTISSKDGVHEIEKGKLSSRNTKLLKKQGYKNKELMGIPWRVAFALSDSGWYLRQDIIWAKATSGHDRLGSCMPESVTDRFTNSKEYIFLFTKNDKYFFDSYAVKEPVSQSSVERVSQENFVNQNGTTKANGGRKTNGNLKPVVVSSGLANMRSVWRINLQPGSSGEHIAGYPEKLVEPCIKAGTSEYGCCKNCGKPYIRILNKDGYINHSWAPNTRNQNRQDELRGRHGETSSLRTDKTINYVHGGWNKQCNCETDEIIPSIVLDPFMGSGTTAFVAAKFGRNFIGFELNQNYIKFANNRLAYILNANKFF